MSSFDWRGLLTRLSSAVLHVDEVEDGFRDIISPQARSSGWLGNPGATENEIVKAEERLGKRLPLSYREFLRVSNGWGPLNDFIYHMWSATEVEWFSARNQDWIDAYTEPYEGVERVSDDEYFVYGERQDPVNIRPEYLQTALEISDVGNDAVVLLNPEILTPAGEWEAMLFANWLPGATRYRSFWDLVQGEYKSFVQSHE